MRVRTVIHLLGQLTTIIGISMILPLLWAIYYGEPVLPLLIPMLLAGGIGILLNFLVKPKGEVRQREAFAVVSIGWLIATLFGLLPYLLSSTLTSFADAFFETMSGFTTTGASVLTNIEAVDKSILMWRSLTHWLGGMGIMVLFIAALSQLGSGGVQMFRAEVPGPSAEKLKPRIKETAKILWLIYVIISVTEIILLWLAGMSLFEAMVHTFGTMATGGFSSRNLSIGAYGSLVHWIIIVFMFIAGANFSLYYQALKGKNLKVFWCNEEFRLYAGIVVFFSVATWVLLALWGEEMALTKAVFQVVSIITTTGYATADFDQWPGLAKGILVFLMFVGGSAGSTGGSVKVGRILLLVKNSLLELRQMVRPRAVLSLKIDNKTVSDRTVMNVTQFFFLYMALTALSTLIMLTSGVDLVTGFTSVAATLGNIGPGLALVGPAENYAFYGSGYKLFMSLLMLIGRLEIYTVLSLFIPSTWKH
ncbi:MAG: TrkH family potassium uptake protein [Thermoanaerobacteraceae bacterium]|nr:TrkH family potassium uptake protein [Thermoanaerobacteraceae bacterium]